MKITQSRNCIQCNKLHNTVIEDREGNVIEELDKCQDCIMSGCKIDYNHAGFTNNNCDYLSNAFKPIILKE